LDRAKAGAMHEGNARTQREEQENPRPLRVHEDHQGALCQGEVHAVEDVVRKIFEGEIFEVVLSEVENVCKVQVDREEILDLFVEEKSALV
jgi:hypothetical protein